MDQINCDFYLSEHLNRLGLVQNLYNNPKELNNEVLKAIGVPVNPTRGLGLVLVNLEKWALDHQVSGSRFIKNTSPMFENVN